MNFPDGQLTLDRCQRHATKLHKLKDEKGSWVARVAGSKQSFKVSSVEDIKQQMK